MSLRLALQTEKTVIKQSQSYVLAHGIWHHFFGMALLGLALIIHIAIILFFIVFTVISFVDYNHLNCLRYFNIF